MTHDLTVKISWKYKSKQENALMERYYNQISDDYDRVTGISQRVYNGKDSIDKYIDMWIDSHTDDWDCENPLDYCDFFAVEILS